MKLSNIKLTPLRMFLLILLVLLISVMFGKYLQPKSGSNLIPQWGTHWGTTEGLIDYNKGVAPLTQIPVKSYNSRSLILVYDGLYYDSVNGNMVDVMSSTTGQADTLGNTVTGFTVIDRNNSTKTYNVDNSKGVVTQNVTESQNNTMISTSNCYTRQDSGDSGTIVQYVYIPWDKDTYLHVVDVTNKRQMITEYIGFNNTGIDSTTYSAYSYADSSMTSFLATSGSYSPIGEENKLMAESSSIYNTTRSIYVVTKNVLYDPQTGNLILRNYDNASAVSGIVVYARSLVTANKNMTVNPAGTPYTTTTKYSDPSPLPSITSSQGVDSMVVYTADKQNMVLYIANGFKTIIAVFRMQTAGQPFVIQNVARFDQFGAFTTGVSSSTSTTAASTTASTTASGSTSGTSSGTNAGTGTSATDNRPLDVNALWASLGTDQGSTDMMRRFFNYYYNTDGTNIGQPFSNDYMLKTQIVPPVCPMCPVCPASTGVCTNCGGNGGSGTQTTNKGNTVSYSNTQPPSSDSDNSDYNGYNRGPGFTQLLQDTGSGATNLVRDAADGTTNLARDAASGTVDLARDAASGTVDLARDAVGGTVDLARDAAGGVAGLLKANPITVNGSRTTSGGTGTSGYGGVGAVGTSGRGGSMSSAPSGTDPYSYYGALPSKSSGNFIPITADFSAFGR